MPIIRKKLDPNDVYPTGLRYNESTGAIQSLVNGTWVDNPEADPRRKTLYPPRVTSDTRCDAAQSVTDALRGQIDQTITAISNGANVTTAAGIILGLFYFGPFGVFIAIALTIARAMLDAGTTALQAALTNEAYDDLKCALDCHMNNQGQLDEAGLSAVESDLSTAPGGLAATILNSMLSLAGFGGVNNLAALGSSTGNCSGCGCQTAIVAINGTFNAPEKIDDTHYLLTPNLRDDGTYTIYVKHRYDACWIMVSTVYTGTWTGDGPHNTPGFEVLKCDNSYQLIITSSQHMFDGENLKSIGFRSNSAFTVTIEVQL